MYNMNIYIPQGLQGTWLREGSGPLHLAPAVSAADQFWDLLYL